MGSAETTATVKAPEETRAKLHRLRGILNEGDEIGGVIRAHTYVENELLEFINSRLARPEALPLLEFNDKVNLAVALGLPEALKPSLHRLGTIRNKFAHDLDVILTDDIVESLYKQFKPIMKNVSQKYCRIFKRRRCTEELSPRDRFGIYAQIVWHFIHKENIKFRSQKASLAE